MRRLRRRRMRMTRKKRRRGRRHTMTYWWKICTQYFFTILKKSYNVQKQFYHEKSVDESLDSNTDSLNT